MSLVATKPLTVDEPWVALEPGEMAVLVQGRRIDASPVLQAEPVPA